MCKTKNLPSKVFLQGASYFLYALWKIAKFGNTTFCWTPGLNFKKYLMAQDLEDTTVRTVLSVHCIFPVILLKDCRTFYLSFLGNWFFPQSFLVNRSVGKPSQERIRRVFRKRAFATLSAIICTVVSRVPNYTVLGRRIKFTRRKKNSEKFSSPWSYFDVYSKRFGRCALFLRWSLLRRSNECNWRRWTLLRRPFR